MMKKSKRVVELDKLIRLQNMRILSAESDYKKSQDELKKVHNATQKRQMRVDSLRVQLNTLLCGSGEEDAQRHVQFSEYFSERKNWLDLDLEKDEYWLQDDLRELGEAEKKFKHDRESWLQLRSRESRTQVFLKTVKTDQSRRAELKQEIEISDMTLVNERK